jgi:hypothetical protein
MKKESSAFTVFSLKVILIACCISNGFYSNAQPIVGKWKLMSAKELITDKATGKTNDLGKQIGDISKVMEEIIEFHADKTYFTSTKMIGNKTGLEATGIYSIAGNQLKLQAGKSNLPANPAANFSLQRAKWPNAMVIESLDGNTLVLQYGTQTTEKGKTFVMDIHDTFMKQ